ncbi:MAG TPA: hypothetical protein ENN08_05910 [Bacteroidales bacterium]|nr:hypothetical protein [Bacteroidales bacterium]
MNIIKTSFTLIIVLLLLGSCLQPASTGKNENPLISTIAENLDDYPVRVLYFHSTNRCQLCLSIEKQVKETVMVEYRDQVESGRLKLFLC